MDLVVASQAVAALVAAGAGKELAEDVGRGLISTVVNRIRSVFGKDRRSVDALEQVATGGSSAAVEELAAALRWYAQRDSGFAAELMRWARTAGAVETHQDVHAGRDAYTAGRDQTVIKYRH